MDLGPDSLEELVMSSYNPGGRSAEAAKGGYAPASLYLRIARMGLAFLAVSSVRLISAFDIRRF